MINRCLIPRNAHIDTGESSQAVRNSAVAGFNSSVVRPLHKESVNGLEGGTGRIDIVLR
jgi:hypothetical protein